MAKLLIKNEKNLFGQASVKPFISEVGFEKLTRCLPTVEASHPELWPAARDLHAWCSALPKMDIFLYCKQEDLLPGETLHANGSPFYGFRPARGWVSVDKFVSKSGHAMEFPLEPTAENFGWAVAEAILKREDEFVALAQWLGITAPNVSAAKGILKKSKTWQIDTSDPQDRMASAESFAIYRGHGASWGYLNDKGGVSPLGGARLFESEEAAKRTIGSRQLQGAVVVAVQARVTGLSPIVPVSGDLGPLNKALAMEEARQLQAVLATASLESLRKRVKELEAAGATPSSNLTDGTQASAEAVSAQTESKPRGRRL